MSASTIRVATALVLLVSLVASSIVGAAGVMDWPMYRGDSLAGRR